MSRRWTLMPAVDAPAQPERRVVRASQRRWQVRDAPRSSGLPSTIPLSLTVLGLIYWIHGVGQIRPSAVKPGGLLVSADVWFVSGLVLLALSFLLELSRARPRTWVMAGQIISLIFAIHASVPIVYGTPEYAWVYKHLGIVGAFEQFGHVTDPKNIYQQWPALFAAVAAVSRLAHVSSTSLALWAPTSFELADALLLLGIFRLVGAERRASWLALFLYEAFVSWVGQDYLSPQAFAYLLFLGLMSMTLRWLRRPASPARTRLTRLTRLARLRTSLLTGLPPAAATTRPTRRFAVILVLLTFAAIVAAHQLTPYAVLVDVAALTLLDLLKPRWLIVMLAVIAGGYLAPRYHIITSNFGGLLSGGDPLQNGAGVQGAHHGGAESTTALIVRVLAIAMWLLSLAVIVRGRRALGRVAVPGLLAFAPFLILGAQSYGGEAIYRVFLFSSPWCALLISRAVLQIRLPRHRVARWASLALASGAAMAALFAGVQGLYGPAAEDAFTHSELSASHWLYEHIPQGSTFVLPVDNFPADEAATYNHFDPEIMPSDPQDGPAWLDEANLPEVKLWLASLKGHSKYLVVSHSMTLHATFYGAPRGYRQLVGTTNDELRPRVARLLGASVVFRNADTTIYRLGPGLEKS